MTPLVLRSLTFLASVLVLPLARSLISCTSVMVARSHSNMSGWPGVKLLCSLQLAKDPGYVKDLLGEGGASSLQHSSSANYNNSRKTVGKGMRSLSSKVNPSFCLLLWDRRTRRGAHSSSLISVQTFAACQARKSHLRLSPSPYFLPFFNPVPGR